MTLQKILSTAVISLGASLLASQAHSVAITDATIHNPIGGLDSSSAAALGQGKIKHADINALTGLFVGDEWNLLDRTNKSSKSFNGVNFVLSADTGQRSGEWGVSWDGTSVPTYMDYVLVLKSGKQWGAYLFESASLGPDLNDLGGTFGISWLNKKGKIAKLRHASIFGRIGEAPSNGPADETGGPGDGTDGPVDPGDGTGGPGDGTGGPGNGTGGPGDGVIGPNANDVPSPGTTALLAMGLMLMLLRQRWHRRINTCPV